jgi:azurin
MKRNLGWLAAIGLGLTGQAWGQECTLTIESNDQMMYNKSELKVSSSCKEVTLTLKHVGKSPATLMGHNWVLSKTADAPPLQNAASAVGPPKYLPQDDPRVLAATDVLGGGQETTIKFDISGLEPGGDYTYFCSFPPHWVLMKGKFVIE